MINKIRVMIIIIIGSALMCTAFSFAENKANASIFEYKKELALTDDQEKNLRGILAKLQDYLTDRTKELNGLRAELNKLISDKADMYVIKAKLRAIAQIQADASCEDIASSRAIEKELTATQLAQWRNKQEEYRKSLQQAQEAASKASEARR